MKYTVLSLGGSLICPKGPDLEYIANFSSRIKDRTGSHQGFIIVTGGGDLARNRINAAIELGETNKRYLDLIGIQATRINALIVGSAFGELASPHIITDINNFHLDGTPIRIAGGTQPGWSTDYVTSQLASVSGADQVINLTCTDGVYDKDPSLYKDAKRYNHLTWKQFREEFDQEWTPGLNSPFDPIAAKLCESENLEVIVADGRDLSNLENILDGNPYVGTTIRSDTPQ